ncbi:hypothetical protein BDW59DRAFT_182141 [Aspergillus cavernicola]|uniref:Uncharacterized protein n=1 Tax=Aspergillus cavernicola TaxID=176166 RepID=A0ABR4IUP4_9EURO
MSFIDCTSGHMTPSESLSQYNPSHPLFQFTVSGIPEFSKHRPQTHSLRTTCADPDSLFATAPETLIHLLYKEFRDDINRLRRAYSLRAANNDSPEEPPGTPSPSFILFQEPHDEVNRTFTSILALRWIHLNHYEAFVASQPRETRLARESFNWLRAFYNSAILTTGDSSPAEALYALIVSIITNDLGKDPHLATEYHSLTGTDISALNHDAILHRACAVPGLIPSSLGSLLEPYKSDLLAGIALGATFNFGQLAQAENSPVSLTALRADELQGSNNALRALQLRFLEQMVDLAGAAGHIDWSCARKLTQPLFESYRDVYEACEGVIRGSLGVCGAYDLVLVRRAERLHAQGLRLLAVEREKEDRGLARLLCMGNVTTVERARLFLGVWGGLDSGVRAGLVDALNVAGCRGAPAVQMTYMPALLSRIRDERALGCALSFLCRGMVVEDGVDTDAVLIERSVLGVLKRYVESGKFDEDPTLLQRVDVPEGVVAQRA